VLADGAAVRGLDPPRLDMLIAEMYELLHGTVSSVRDHKEEIGEAFVGLTRTLKGTGDFFEQNKGHLDKIAENTEKITADAQDLVKGAKGKFVENPQIDRILASVERVSGDAARDVPPMLADGKVAVANARRVAEVLGDPKEAAKLRQMLDDVSVVARQAKGMTGDAAEILAHVKRGKGTVGAVVMDEQLYDDLQEMVRDLKHNPWKFFWRE
jgi:phospholipid/cholesterol/gamma-HCH transport system substrate-binding protein